LKHPDERGADKKGHPVTTTVSAAVAPRRIGRSILAVLAGFVVVVVLSLGTDELFHLLKVYPPWGVPMREPGLNLLALTYRSAFTFIGGYVTARLAPYSPMRHVLVGCGIGLVLGALGVVVATTADLGPIWYPIAVAATGPVFNWVGGMLFVNRTAINLNRKLEADELAAARPAAERFK
jgi:hypothetical protein